MEREEALARERLTDPTLPNVLRLYTWQPHAVSIGYQQKMESVDVEACQAAGVDVVRRPTGGRAVLHANELTYGVVLRAEVSLGIYAVHNFIIEALLASLEGLGAEYSSMEITGRTTAKPFNEIYSAGTLTNEACFASSARHEVTYHGRKVIGSAQRRFGEVVLQHGSILLTNDHLRLTEFLALPEAGRARMRELLMRETATLSDVFQRPISADEAADSIQERFVTHFSGQQQCQTKTAPLLSRQSV